jgi:hypothetical protein
VPVPVSVALPAALATVPVRTAPTMSVPPGQMVLPRMVTAGAVFLYKAARYRLPAQASVPPLGHRSRGWRRRRPRKRSVGERRGTASAYNSMTLQYVGTLVGPTVTLASL